MLRIICWSALAISIAVGSCALAGHVLSSRDSAVRGREQMRGLLDQCLAGWHDTEAHYRVLEDAVDRHMAIDEDVCACWQAPVMGPSLRVRREVPR